jgi:hypothetical protein
MITGRIAALALRRAARQPADTPSGAGRRGTAAPGPEPAGPTGFVVLRLDARHAGRAAGDAASLREVARRAELGHLTALLDRFDVTDGTRLVRAIPPSRLLELEARAANSALPPLRSLTAYWLLDMRNRPERIEELVKALLATPGVDAAYPQVPMGDPVVNAADDDYAAQQGYLDAAPAGIDARWAWTQPNGEGAGIGVVDLEQGWLLGHEDYAAKAPVLLAGDNRDGVGPYVGNHGCAVLGEMIADDNTRGVVGIAPSAGPVAVTSHYDQATNTTGLVANAIAGALPSMNPGDILVLEIQTTPPDPFGAPCEYVDDAFDAVRLASALGMVVVEAAGNGNQNLDTLQNAGRQVLNPASADFRESGAIIVGAGESTLPHDRMGFSSFGARVDCYAWGENVTTAGYGDLDNGGGDADASYTAIFGGTSSATPIVAGAALILQGMHAANTGTRISPLAMRALLSDPVTGTAQGNGVAGNIGVMPNLRAIIEDTLGIAPDVYIRDTVGDTGTVPTAGSLSSSPDIIVRPVAVADPDAAFGEASGTAGDNTLGFEVEAGQDNFLYVRMRNRGGDDALGVTAQLFWSPASTLVTPDLWTPIGTTAPVDVPQGDTLVVTGALAWPSADIPAAGHYCFVGILSHAADPAPPVPIATDWNGFRAFIANNNNVAWRNFNVVDSIGDPAADPAVLPFLIANAPGERRFFSLSIERRLARGVEVALEVPMVLGRELADTLGLKVEWDREGKRARIHLPAAPALVVPQLLLPAAARFDCRFIVTGLGKHGREGNSLAIAQHFEEQQVGRVTWHFLKPRKA